MAVVVSVRLATGAPGDNALENESAPALEPVNVIPAPAWYPTSAKEKKAANAKAGTQKMGCFIGFRRGDPAGTATNLTKFG